VAVRSLGTSRRTVARTVAGTLAALLIAGLVAVSFYRSFYRSFHRSGSAPSSSDDGEQTHAPLSTPWTSEVSPRNALPEYPRPQLRRPTWRNLDGVWQFAGAGRHQAHPTGRRIYTYDGRVPKMDLDRLRALDERGR
jgi:hypothetical protein